MTIINKNSISIVLTIMILLSLLFSSYFFLIVLKLSIWKWFLINACSLAIIVYLLCYILHKITKKEYILAIPILPLYYYGTMGLFMMPWIETNIFPQITHIIITLNLLWLLYLLITQDNYKSLGKGLLISIIIFVPVFAVIQYYSQIYHNELMQIIEQISH